MDLQAGELLPPDVDPLEIGEELQRRYERAVGRADQGGDAAPAGAAVPDRQAAAPAQRPRLRRRRAGADQHAGRQQAADADQGRRGRAAQHAAVPADRDQRGREPGPEAAQRHRQLPRLPGAEERPARYRRPSRRTAGSRRSTTRWWRRSRSSCAAGWRRRRSSTRSSSTAGTCPSRRAATSGPPRRPVLLRDRAAERARPAHRGVDGAEADRRTSPPLVPAPEPRPG